MVVMKLKKALFIILVFSILTGCATNAYNKQYYVTDASIEIEENEG
jgi:uncharacterized lipoprotein YmbA